MSKPKRQRTVEDLRAYCSSDPPRVPDHAKGSEGDVALAWTTGLAAFGHHVAVLAAVECARIVLTECELASDRRRSADHALASSEAFLGDPTPERAKSADQAFRRLSEANVRPSHSSPEWYACACVATAAAMAGNRPRGDRDGLSMCLSFAADALGTTPMEVRDRIASRLLAWAGTKAADSASIGRDGFGAP